MKPIANRVSIVLAVVVIALLLASNVRFEKESMDEEFEMFDAREPYIVEFPVRGEWLAPNTPGTKIPSHGSNKLGTRYAYDFIQVDWDKSGWPSYRGSLPQYLIFGIPISDYYCWGQEIYSPCDGVVVRAEDGYAERGRTKLFTDLAGANRAARHFDPKTDDVRSVAGNFVIIEIERNVYAALCHLQTGSVQVTVGRTVKQGDLIGNVGHSGNSFGPHLHFQLMDSSDIETANGLPCAFEHYEVYKDGEWVEITNGIPTDKERIRYKQEVKL
jgi:hypothetical protein